MPDRQFIPCLQRPAFEATEAATQAAEKAAGLVVRQVYSRPAGQQGVGGQQARLAFGFGWRVSLVAETLGSSDGIGYRLRQAADLVQTDQVFAWTLLLVALMLALEGGILKPLERHLFRWKPL